MEFGLERLAIELWSSGQGERVTQVIVERRGRREDDSLELAFRRICDGKNALRRKLPFELVMIQKSANSTGLQLADLVARPVGIKVLRSEQANRAYDIVSGKFRRSPAGEIQGWGLKIFPWKCERPPGNPRSPTPTGNFQSDLASLWGQTLPL